jgi:NADH-quinone oxidoreductase subunit H
MGFALFFLAEYGSIILMSLMTVILFLGGWLFFPRILFFIDPFVLGFKTSFILFFFIWVRASFPRYRVDQLMRLCWKIFLPMSFTFVLLILSILFCFNGFFLKNKFDV